MSLKVKQILHVVLFLLGALSALLGYMLHSDGLMLSAPVLALFTETKTLVDVLKGAVGSFDKAAVLLLALGVALVASACTGAQGQVLKQQAVDCGKGELGKFVPVAVAVTENAIKGGEPAGELAQTIAVDAGAAGIDFVVCSLTKLAGDLQSASFRDGPPPAAQVAAVLGSYLDAHPSAKAKTYDVSRVAVAK